MNASKLQELLNKRKSELIGSNWNFLESNWKKIKVKKGHRTELKDIPDIQTIKQNVLDKIGYLGPFIFLNEFFYTHDWSGPYRNVEKGILLMYHLLSGHSFGEMSKFIPQTTFQTLHHELFHKKYYELNLWLEKMLDNCFSSSSIRVLSAQLYNPQKFKNITMYADGHDTRVNYNSMKEIIQFQRGDLYSYKLRKSGCRTQVMIDINKMIIGISNSEKCGKNNDGSMFLRWRPDMKMSRTDCLQLDGGYTQFVNQLIEMNEEAGGDLNTSKFSAPIRKYQGKDMSLSESQYNDRFGSKRSEIETSFADIGSIFQKFSWNHSQRISTLQTFNIELKLACFLMNVKRSETFLTLDIKRQPQVVDDRTI